MPDLTPDQRDTLGMVAAGHASFDLRFDNPTVLLEVLDGLVALGLAVLIENERYGYMIAYDMTAAGWAALEE